MAEAPKKPFTAELQRQRMAGGPASAPAAANAWQASSEILDAIAALRQDVKSLQTLLSRSEHLDAEMRERLTQDKVALENEQAEVDLLRTEVRALGRCIQQTKAEIAALRPANTGGDHILTVTNELDAVVNSTEGATQQILECSENIENLLHNMHTMSTDANVHGLADQVSDQVVKIYEACNFQDITGQRITKVVNTLKFIEGRITAMIEIWGKDDIAGEEPAAGPGQLHTADELVSGPQLPSQAISQDDIDKLFG